MGFLLSFLFLLSGWPEKVKEKRKRRCKRVLQLPLHSIALLALPLFRSSSSLRSTVMIGGPQVISFVVMDDVAKPQV